MSDPRTPRPSGDHARSPRYERSVWSALLELVGGVGCLGVAAPCLGGATFLFLKVLARAGLWTPTWHDPGFARPIALWEPLVGLVALGFGAVMVRYGLFALLGLVLPRERVVAVVEERSRLRGRRGWFYSVTIGGVRSDATQDLYDAVAQGQRVRVERTRLSRSIVRVWRAP